MTGRITWIIHRRIVTGIQMDKTGQGTIQIAGQTMGRMGGQMVIMAQIADRGTGRRHARMGGGGRSP
jgi:hypothetical protein